MYPSTYSACFAPSFICPIVLAASSLYSSLHRLCGMRSNTTSPCKHSQRYPQRAPEILSDYATQVSESCGLRAQESHSDLPSSTSSSSDPPQTGHHYPDKLHKTSPPPSSYTSNPQPAPAPTPQPASPSRHETRERPARHEQMHGSLGRGLGEVEG